jgi:DNA polymerase
MQEINAFHFNEVMNDRGVPIDKNSVDKLVTVSDELQQLTNLRVYELTNGEVETAKSVQQSLKFLRNHGVDLTDLKAATVRGLLTKPIIDTLPLIAVELLKLRQTASKSSTAKFVAMQETVSFDNRIHGMMFYHGAHTGRWTSRLVQLQNLPRGLKGLTPESIDTILSKLHLLSPADFIDYLEFKWVDLGTPMQILTGLIRPMICAEKGKKFIVYDYSTIEARVLAWLSGCTTILDLYRSGGDAYRLMASKIFNIPIEEIQKPSYQRDVGKEAVLGAGYGMGWSKFYEATTAKGISITEGLAKNIIATYRESFPEIPTFWAHTGAAAKEALNASPGNHIFVSDTLPLCFYNTNNFVFCQLPSGRQLSYPLMECKTETNPYNDMPSENLYYWGVSAEFPWSRKKLYGAKFVENIVQAVARDIMVDAMIKLEASGFPISFSVHDEIICEVDESLTTPEKIKEFEEIMRTPPDWAKGVPLEVEGYVAQRYRK